MYRCGINKVIMYDIEDVKDIERMEKMIDDWW